MAYYNNKFASSQPKLSVMISLNISQEREPRILDRNTVKYMIEKQQKEIEGCRKQLNQKTMN